MTNATFQIRHIERRIFICAFPFLSCILALCLSSCSDDNDGKDTTEEIEEEVNLGISPTSVSVAAEGETFTVTVTCNADYSVDITDDWLTLNSDNGGTLSVTAAANTSTNSRTATITIAAGDVSGTVTVTQAGVENQEDSSDSSDGDSNDDSSDDSGDSSDGDSDDDSDDGSDDSDSGSSDDNADDESDDSIEVSYEASGTVDGYEYVDLGLSVKWATCNVGADSPESYGDYYAWGEIDTKSTYISSNSVTYGASLDDISGNAGYDVARAEWGSKWRLPTYDECYELVNNCTWRWTTKEDVKGYSVTGTNGNSIFLPAAGNCHGSSVSYTGSYGRYWSSSPGTDTSYAYHLDFSSYGHGLGSTYRYRGHTIRPVSE